MEGNMMKDNDFFFIRDINEESVSKYSRIMVQVLFPTIVSMKNCTIFKCILLDRSVMFNSNSLSPYDEIELVSFLNKRNINEDELFYRNLFKENNILIMKDFIGCLRKSNNYNNLPHQFNINYSRKDNNPFFTVIKNLDFMSHQLGYNLNPISLENYFSTFPFTFQSLESVMDKKNKGKIVTKSISLIGIIEYKCDIDGSGNSKRLNFSIIDSKGYKITCTAFDKAINSNNRLINMKVNDIIYIRGASISSYNGGSLTINENTLIVPTESVIINKILSEEYKKLKRIINNINTIHINNVSDYDLSQKKDHVLGTLEDILDEHTCIDSSDPIRKHQVNNCEIISINITNMFKYQCCYIPENSNKKYHCMKKTNLCNGKWICTQESEDGSLPTINGISYDEQMEKKLLGHICDNVLIRLFLKILIKDDTVNSPLLAYLGHEMAEKLFNKSYQELALLNDYELNLLVEKIIESNKRYYIKATSKFSPSSSHLTNSNYGSLNSNSTLTSSSTKCFFQINFIKEQ
jgi:hypothetical protein